MSPTTPLQITRNDSLTLKIVNEVADREGVDPLALDPPLQTVVDIDSLEDRFAPPFSNEAVEERVAFTYCGYRVTIARTDDLRLRIDEIQSEDDSHSISPA